MCTKTVFEPAMLMELNHHCASYIMHQVDYNMHPWMQSLTYKGMAQLLNFFFKGENGIHMSSTVT